MDLCANKHNTMKDEWGVNKCKIIGGEDETDVIKFKVEQAKIIEGVAGWEWGGGGQQGVLLGRLTCT